MLGKHKKAARNIQKAWHLSDRMDIHGAKIYFILLDRLGAIDVTVEEIDGAIQQYRAQLAVIADEISKIQGDELMMKAAVKKQNINTALLHYSLKKKTQAHVFLGEFESAVKLYEESKTYACTSDEDDKFFDLLFNQKVVNFNNVVVSKNIVMKMARAPMMLTSEKGKFFKEMDAQVNSIDEISFFTICLAKKMTPVNMFQFELTNLREADEASLKAFWTKVSSYCTSGVNLRLIAIERMGW